MNEQEIREALSHVDVDDPRAEERSWQVARAAYRQLEPDAPRSQRRSRWRWPGVAAAVTALAVIGGGVAGAAATTPSSGVGRFVRHALGIGAPRARPALARLPGGGRLLVQAPTGTWVVAHDGAARRIGEYSGASWSPRGLFVAAWHGGVLTAVEPGGTVHWSLSRQATIRAARWSPLDGFRIGYLSGDALWIVDGDGTANRRYAAALGSVAPAWRPDDAHVLAYVDLARRVNVVAVDTRRLLWRSAPIAEPVALTWSAGGRRLLVVARRQVSLYDGDGRRVVSRRLPGAVVAQSAAWSPRAAVVALVRADASGATSELVLLDAARGLRSRVLFSGPGRLGAPTWAPDGRTVLLPWPAARQWLFLHPRGSLRPTAVVDVAREFAPGASRPGTPSTVIWCCSATEP